MAHSVPENIHFPTAEEEVCQVWREIDAFRTSLKLSKGKPRYVFYDGPPFATGLPHYGHILAGTIKDVVTRWAHQSGYHVERRFGWDTHGLPIEYEIDKRLGVKTPEDVQKMGITAYNAECRKIVMRYAGEWEVIIGRLGRWIDFDNDYKTMYPSFMESVWWVFTELFNKGLVYRGSKVMPYSTACNTPLSNFESSQNYKDVVDPAVIVSFPLEENAQVSMLAWTTTPWTLPSNLSLCVNPGLDYVKVQDAKTNNVYILMEARLQSLYASEEEYKILERFKGKTLEGKHYHPLFPYFQDMRETVKAFRVLTDDYVTAESGTGVVHQAPYFGEDDQRVCLNNGIITKDMAMVCPVDASGRFTDEVSDFEGQYVKDADKNIVKHLKAAGRLVHHGTVKHSYPFCWRSETPLIYKAVPSWFIRVQMAQEKLLKNNAATYWNLDFVKEKRFGNWLREARDWAVSRNRYWGTPIPIWTSEDGLETVCVGSIAELEKLTGTKVTDLHRESLDHLTIPSKQGKGELRRVPEVFDCWFESGSMPYAQAHYPFENKREFEENFPADFISEGIDQTRGWFYTLLVLSTLLFDKPPFKNLIVHGLVLAGDGQKMSKRKKNYPDPMDIVHKYGADALRLYLVNSPAVRADNLRFKEEGVRDVLKDVFLPWYNAYRFLMQNVDYLEKREGVCYVYREESTDLPENYMDRWILSFTQSLIKFVQEEMAAYRLHKVMSRLIRFVDQLTNWYVRMNRRRLRGDMGQEECHHSLDTLFSVVFSMIRLMAPFTPFLTETMYQNMRHAMESTEQKGQDKRSIHFLMLPQPREKLIHTKMEEAVQRMQTTIELGRVIRDRKTLPVKYPLKEIVVIHQDPTALEDIQSLKNYVLEELNVRTLTTTMDKDQYGVRLRAEPEHRVLGAKLKGDFKRVMAAIKELKHSQLVAFKETGSMEVCGQTLVEEDVRIFYTLDSATGKPSHYEAHSEGELLVLLDVSPDQAMQDEGIAREVINRIQRLRKKAKLVVSDEIQVFYETTNNLARIIKEFSEFIFATTKQPLVPLPLPAGANVIIQETADVKGDKLGLTLVGTPASRNSGSEVKAATPMSKAGQLAPAPVKNGVRPVCKFVNVALTKGLQPGCGVTGTMATLLLENPCGANPLSPSLLLAQAAAVFGLRGSNLQLYWDHALERPVNLGESGEATLSGLASRVIYLAPAQPASDAPCCAPLNVSAPVCHFANVDHQGAGGDRKGTVLLENPRGFPLTADELSTQMSTIFQVAEVKLEHKADLLSLHCTDLELNSAKGKVASAKVKC